MRTIFVGQYLPLSTCAAWLTYAYIYLFLIIIRRRTITIMYKSNHATDIVSLSSTKLWLILSYRNIFCEAIKYSLVFVANEFYYYCIFVDSNLLLSFQTNNCLVKQFMYCCFSKFLILKFHTSSVLRTCKNILCNCSQILLIYSRYIWWKNMA